MGQVHIILGVVDTGTLFGEVGFVTIFIIYIYIYLYTIIYDFLRIPWLYKNG